MTIITNVCQWSRDRTGHEPQEVPGNRELYGDAFEEPHDPAWYLAKFIGVSGGCVPLFLSPLPLSSPHRAHKGKPLASTATADGSMELVVEHRRRTRRRAISIRDDASPWHSPDAFRFLMTGTAVNEKCGARCTQPSAQNRTATRRDWWPPVLFWLANQKSRRISAFCMVVGVDNTWVFTISRGN